MALNRTSWLIGIVVLIHQAAFGVLDPTVLPVRYGQYGRSVAVGPQNALVIWTDYRRTVDLSSEIYGTRVDTLGQALDGDGVPLTGVVRGSATVTALKDQFLIVWGHDTTIYARRMTSAGELLDTQPITVSTNPSHPDGRFQYGGISAAADGTNFWVAWTDHRGFDEDIYAARISPAGRVLDPGGIKICNRAGNQNTPRLSERADFVAWVDSRPTRRSIFGARLHAKGFALDNNGFRIMSSTNQYVNLADVSGNGRSWLVLWSAQSGIYANQIGKRAAVSYAFPIARTDDQAFPHVEASGLDYLVVWQAGGSVVGKRVTGKSAGQLMPLAGDPTGQAVFSVSSFAGNRDRFCLTGTTGPKGASWMYNDVWYGSFTASLLP
jgi:hypothetical protein